MAYCFDNSKPTVLVTGSNRGIGLEFVTQYASDGYNVIATCRNPNKAKALHLLQTKYTNIHLHKLDVTHKKQVQELVTKLKNIPIDIVIHNAGIKGYKASTTSTRFWQMSADALRESYETNTIGAFELFSSLLANVARSEYKALVAISSGYASISDNTSGGSCSYRMSKAALNMLMRTMTNDLKQSDIKEYRNIIAFPITAGWVKTDMGGPNARLTANESVSMMRKTVAEVIKSRDTSKLHTYNGTGLAW